MLVSRSNLLCFGYRSFLNIAHNFGYSLESSITFFTDHIQVVFGTSMLNVKDYNVAFHDKGASMLGLQHPFGQYFISSSVIWLQTSSEQPLVVCVLCLYDFPRHFGQICCLQYCQPCACHFH